MQKKDIKAGVEYAVWTQPLAQVAKNSHHLPHWVKVRLTDTEWEVQEYAQRYSWRQVRGFVNWVLLGSKPSLSGNFADRIDSEDRWLLQTRFIICTWEEHQRLAKEQEQKYLAAEQRKQDAQVEQEKCASAIPEMLDKVGWTDDRSNYDPLDQFRLSYGRDVSLPQSTLLRLLEQTYQAGIKEGAK